MPTARKYSRKREAILECIRSTTSHPSADWVYSQLKPEIPDLSLGTVYRNLNLFRQEGLIQSIGVVNGLERFDGNIQPHLHFVCQKCGKVQDMMEFQLPEGMLETAAKSINGKIQSCQIVFTGTCETCSPSDE